MKKPLLFLLTSLLGLSTSHAQWVSQSVAFSADTYYPASLQAVDASAAWAVGSNPSGMFTPQGVGTQEVARTTGGNSWQTSTVPSLAPDEVITSLTAQSAASAWITTIGSTRSQILHTTDGGTSWQPMLTLTSPTADRSLNYLGFFDASHGLCLGDADNGDRLVLFTTTDGGTTWTANQNLPLLTDQEYLTSVSRPAIVGNHIWVATTASRVFHSADRGLSWSVSELPAAAFTPNGPRALAFADAQHGLALFSRTDGFTDNAPLYRTTDGGATWQAVPFAGPLHGSNLVLVPGTGNYLSVGENLPVPGIPADAGSSYSRDAGATWTALESTDNHQLLTAAGPLAIWSSSYNFTTGRSNGVRKLASPVLPTRSAQTTLAARLQAYPNPSPDGHFTLEIAGGAAGAPIRVFDQLGREVYHTTWPAASPNRQQLHLTSQPAGLYLLQVGAGAATLRQTVWVQ
ncbi:YCF48-related protein [Hymenobacter cellulosivorans]|uniref:YCF48-related protein n=1 Tax=Hymenobacter cellulosivorans TaxID=2932249 RepID=A0ABY4F9H8_9BACT|nr:YCF48-related protein [Hymenobacter cellulosivorans]UOQ52782.1 YCF48-related protein [Hymenobacter cellulosivorans]